jgi:predicted Zn-dependent peptidase
VNLTQQPAFDPTLAIFAAQPKQGVDPAKCEAAIFDELEKIKNAPISDQELEKAKNIRLVEFYHQMRTINGRANTIGTYEVFFGDYNKVFAAAKNYAAVSKEDVQRVAQKYFSANNRTVGTLVPDNARDRGAK